MLICLVYVLCEDDSTRWCILQMVHFENKINYLTWNCWVKETEHEFQSAFCPSMNGK